MRMKLTEAALKKYKPKTDRDEIFDTEKPGFGVRAAATSKAFFYIRRIQGQKVRFDLGRFFPKEELARARKNPAIDSSKYVSLSEARQKAQDILIKIENDIDPREEIKAGRQAAAEAAENTFAHVAKRFIAEYAEGKKEPLRKKTVEGYVSALQGHLTAKWSARPVSEITDRDVIRAIDKLEADKHFASALLFRAHLSKFFNWCIGKRLIRENPTRGVPLASTVADFKRDRVLTIPELQAVLEAANGLGEPWRGYVPVLILTGQRRTETAMMKWSDLTLDGDKPLWKIPAANTKNRQAHEVSLSTEAVEILSRMPKLGEYVFTTNGEGRINNFSGGKKALDKATAKAKLEKWRLHDLRRSVATGMAEELGIAPHIIEAALNHVSGTKGGIAGLYNKSKYPADCRRALAAWAQAVTGKDAGDGKIVELRRA